MFNRISNRASNLRHFILFVITFVISFLLFKFVFLISYVPTSSMEPTVKAQTFCLCSRLNYDGYEKGDIIVFKKDGELLMKRISATGGETYECDSKTYEVPEGHFFVRGDNTDNSFDSRYWDNPYVAEEDIVATFLFGIKGTR